MYDMGRLRKYLPITHATFLIACLAIAGIPPFSGFFSKDEIMAAALHHNLAIYIIMSIVSGLTAFYMFRLYYSIFWGKEVHYHHTPHEAPLVMTFPLMFLAAGAAFAGFIPFSDFVSSDRMPFESHLEMGVAIPAVIIALLGIGLATLLYRKESPIPDRIAASLKGFYTAAFRKFYVDELYLFVTKKIIFNHISRPIAWFDRHIVDGSMNGLSYITNQVSNRIKGFQSGQLQHYALAFVSGAVVLALVFIYFWTN
jgi:NADH-quinone oxidoreductase subunit L